LRGLWERSVRSLRSERSPLDDSSFMMDSLSLKSSRLLIDLDAPEEDYFSRFGYSFTAGGLAESRGNGLSYSFLAEGLLLMLMEPIRVLILSSTWLTLLIVLANCVVLAIVCSISLCSVWTGCRLDCLEKSWENSGLNAVWSLLLAMAYCCWMVLWYLAVKSPSSRW
jgi:hypothetical protein